MLKKLKPFLILIVLIICLIFTIINSNIVINDVLDSLDIFIYKIFPAMFFFYTLTDLLINYNFIKVLEILFDKLFLKAFHISGSSSFIVIMSMISGFPSGSKYITTFREKKLISINKANYLLTFTHFSNPLFILGTISLIFDRKTAIIILITNYLSNFILAFIIRPKEIEIEKVEKNIKKESFSTTLALSFNKSAKILLLILGNTIFFYTFSNILTFYIKNMLIKSIIYGLFDLTKGIISLKNINITLFFKVLLINSFIMFGGISVHYQVKEIIRKEKLDYKYFLFGRISSLAISILLLITYFTIIIV